MNVKILVIPFGKYLDLSNSTIVLEEMQLTSNSSSDMGGIFITFCSDAEELFHIVFYDGWSGEQKTSLGMRIIQNKIILGNNKIAGQENIIFNAKFTFDEMITGYKNEEILFTANNNITSLNKISHICIYSMSYGSYPQVGIQLKSLKLIFNT